MTLKRLSLVCGSVAALCGMPVLAVDVTIPDTLPSNIFGAPNGPAGEWREVEAGAASGNEWDFRAFDAVEVTQGVTYTLTVFSGYDLNNGIVGAGRTGPTLLTVGDIFIDVDRDAKWGSAAPTFGDTGTDNPAAGNNNWLWDMVIAFDQADVAAGGNLDYKVYTLTEDAGTQLKRTTDYTGSFNDKAGPYLYVSGGTEIASGTAVVTTYAAGGGGDPTGLAGNKLEITIDGAFLTAILTDPDFVEGAGIYAHLTQECGNDLLMGGPHPRKRSVPTPDGGTTLVLLGGGLAALGLLRRRLA